MPRHQTSSTSGFGVDSRFIVRIELHIARLYEWQRLRHDDGCDVLLGIEPIVRVQNASPTLRTSRASSWNVSLVAQHTKTMCPSCARKGIAIGGEGGRNRDHPFECQALHPVGKHPVDA